MLSDSLRIMLVGSWNFFNYQEAFAQALEKLGHEVIRKAYGKRQRHYYGESWCGRKVQVIEARVRDGIFFRKINREIVEDIERCKPQVVFLYHALPIRCDTIKRVKALFPGVCIACHTNDNPFGIYRFSWLTWRHFKAVVPLCDIVFAFRDSDEDGYRKLGCKRLSFLRAGYIESLHKPVRALDKRDIDVVYIGHYENDGRMRYLDALHAAGIEVKIYGQTYQWRGVRRPWLNGASVRPVYGTEYVNVLGRAKVALVFLSGRHRDDYTRRCFEIPAVETVMACPGTEYLMKIFESGKEAIFYTDPDDLVEKVRNVLSDAAYRYSIARSGRLKVVKGGHSIEMRAARVVQDLREVLSAR